MALITCPECGKSISDKAKMCVHCGFELNNNGVKCPECGSAIMKGEKVCKVCGYPIESEEVTQIMPMETADILPAELLTDETAVELINYIQFSVAKIINGKSKGLLEDEFNTVINNINPSSLQNMDLISAYDILLKALSTLKLNENQREKARKILEKKKKSAITHSLNSFGSIFVPGGNVVTMFASAAYTGISAVLNYKRAIDEASIENTEDEFEINQNDLECIDALRADLFIATAKVFSNKSNSVQGLVSENEMKQFALCANEIADGNIESINSTLVLMESAEDVLKAFPPYWVVLAVGYNKVGNKNACFEALNNFDKLMENNPIFKKNPFVLTSAKTRINNIIGNLGNGKLSKNDKETIANCIEMIKNNTPSLQQETDNLNFDLVQLYGIVGDFDNALKAISYLKTRNLIEKNNRLETQLKFMQNNALKSPEAVVLVEKAFSSVSFGLSEDTQKIIIQNKLENKIDFKKAVFFYFGSNAEIYSISFSSDGKSQMTSSRFNKYEVETENGGKGSIIETIDLTWNDLAEKPFIEIKTNQFTAIFKSSVNIINEDWPYNETVLLKGKITKDTSLLSDKGTISQSKSLNVKDDPKAGSTLAEKVVSGGLGLIGLISTAWKGKDKPTWLIITLVSIKDAKGNNYEIIDNNNQLLLEDFRG